MPSLSRTLGAGFVGRMAVRCLPAAAAWCPETRAGIRACPYRPTSRPMAPHADPERRRGAGFLGADAPVSLALTGTTAPLG
jgi:hypothetical protein